MRDALVRQESAVEALEEDLEAARAAVARSTGAERELLQAAEALRGQLARRSAQEEQTRAASAGARARAARRRHRAGRRSTTPSRSGCARRCAEVGIITRDPGVLALFRDLAQGRAGPAADPASPASRAPARSCSPAPRTG